MDDMIKSSGFRISPMELEELIYSAGLVSECVALDIPYFPKERPLELTVIRQPIQNAVTRLTQVLGR